MDPEIYQVGNNGIVEASYHASITRGKRRVSLGTFGTYQEAEDAIVEQQDAPPSENIDCHDCEGTGVYEGDECNMCAGTGEIPK